MSCVSETSEKKNNFNNRIFAQNKAFLYSRPELAIKVHCNFTINHHQLKFIDIKTTKFCKLYKV